MKNIFTLGDKIWLINTTLFLISLIIFKAPVYVLTIFYIIITILSCVFYIIYDSIRRRFFNKV